MRARPGQLITLRTQPPMCGAPAPTALAPAAYGGCFRSWRSMARRPAVLMYLIAAEAEAHAKRRQCIKIRSRRCLRRRSRDCLPREELQITARRAAVLHGGEACMTISISRAERADLGQRGAQPAAARRRTHADERTTVPVDTAEGGQVVRLTHLLRLNPPDGRSSHIEWQPEGHRRL